MQDWLTLIISLPTENATVRMRAWRTLKASGAVVLRDGVYLLPAREPCRALLSAVSTEIREGGGTALLLRVAEPEDADFTALFDRSEAYAAIVADAIRARDAFSALAVDHARKQVRALRKTYAALAEIDFFPGEPQRQADTVLQELEIACSRAVASDEPHAASGVIARLDRGLYLGRTWATRQRPWVDRLASAWLIRRFIDPRARFLWLAAPGDCPPDAVGFDFDGATFSHVGSRVTFEVLVASFALDSTALARLGLLVHFLDVGGVQPPEAAGVESVLAGLRDGIADDDQLLVAAQAVFDGLLATFNKGDNDP